MARVIRDLRAGPSRKSCVIRFVNDTDRKVSIIWIDYDGSCQMYAALNSKMCLDIYTYEGHPWISEDYVTKHRLLLNKMNVFIPRYSVHGNRPIFNIFNRKYLAACRRMTPCFHRELVTISIPMFTLEKLAMEVIVRAVPHKNDISKLPLPKIVGERLKKYYDDDEEEEEDDGDDNEEEGDEEEK